MNAAMNASNLEAALRELGAARYHVHHPFHKLLHDGKLSKTQVQAWAINRYCYQAAIPRKDAALMARCEDRELRRLWRQRLVDHDGESPDDGGIARWLVLTRGLGLDDDLVTSQRAALPATHYAVEAYIHFVQERSLLEAVASSLTELFAPDVIAQRVSAMLAHYDFIDEATLAYFDVRLTQAPRDADYALAFVKRHALTAEQQQVVLDALAFKCEILWTMLDALYHAYVEPGHTPPGAFAAEDR